MSEAKKEEGGAGAMIASALGWIITAVACVAAGWIARELVPEEKAAGAPPAMPPSTVAVTNAEMRVYNPVERFVAHAEAAKEIDLLPQVDGFIKELKFAEGDTVKEGQVLYLIDDERYAAVVEQRAAEVDAAKAEAERADLNYKRMKETRESNPGAVAQQQVDDAQSAYKSAVARVKLAEQNLKEANYYLSHTVIKAPLTGKIGKSNAQPGDYVSPSKGALAHLVQLDPIRVTFSLPDRDYFGWKAAEKRGDDVDRRLRLRLPDGSMFDGEGTFDFDDSQMNSATAAITIRLKFPNPEGLLRPGTYLTLLSDYRTPPSYPSVPQTAIIEMSGGRQGVWAVSEDGKVHAKSVATLGAFEGWVPATEGLAEGETVVTSGTGKLMEGGSIVAIAPTPNAENEADHKTYDEREAEGK